MVKGSHHTEETKMKMRATTRPTCPEGCTCRRHSLISSLQEKKCIHCGNCFRPASGVQKHCSDECRKISRSETVKKYQSLPHVRKRRAERQAIKNRVKTQTLRKKVFEKSDGLCGICGDPVGSDFHIDHIVPKSLGGPDTLDNFQASHPICNLRKGNRIGQ